MESGGPHVAERPLDSGSTSGALCPWFWGCAPALPWAESLSLPLGPACPGGTWIPETLTGPQPWAPAPLAAFCPASTLMPPPRDRPRARPTLPLAPNVPRTPNNCPLPLPSTARHCGQALFQGSCMLTHGLPNAILAGGVGGVLTSQTGKLRLGVCFLTLLAETVGKNGDCVWPPARGALKLSHGRRGAASERNGEGVSEAGMP